MRPMLSLCASGLCTVALGCNLVFLSTSNVFYETQLKTSEVVDCYRYRRLADEAWKTIGKGTDGRAFSGDYAAGFKAGFVDYLYEGRCGAPPLPPHHYWKPRYETATGHQAIQEWYAGYEHGVAAARASGYRQEIVLPIPLGDVNWAPDVPPMVEQAGSPPVTMGLLIKAGRSTLPSDNK